jgi:hypothetical protein
MLHSLRSLVGLLLVVLVLTSGCAVQKLLNRGDKLLKDRDYPKAIATYEEALRIEPGNKVAHDRIKIARRDHVRLRLAEAEAALSSGELANALGDAQRARRMPLDLEDVELVRQIDATIDKAAQLAEDRVKSYVDKGHFLAAVDLSQQIGNASPGVTSREKWAAEVRDKAIDYYASLAKSLKGDGVYGSAAIQLAAARALGAEVRVSEVRELWNRFTEPTCFASPQVDVADKSGKAKELVAKIQTTALSELERVRAGCGEGSRKLGVKITLAKVDIVDATKVTRAAKPLAGVDIATEEVYYEEEPYTETEEVTEYETKIEKRELRDCAPRPGKDRGCSTWVEEVEVKVPIKKNQEVTKVRKIRKSRPIQGPLPEDKVLTYDVTTVNRRVAYEGTVTLTGEVDKTLQFAVKTESTDSSNPEVTGKGLTIPADPMRAKPLSDLTAEAAEGVAEEVRRAVAETAKDWAKSFEEQAQKRILAGQMPQAEELYLKELALGASASKELKSFFDERYGRNVAAVMEMLAVALGREVAARAAGEAPAEGSASAFFPKHVRNEEPAAEEAPLPPTTAQIKDTKAPAVIAVPAKAKGPGISDDELKALEDASLDTLKTKAPPVAGTEPAPATGDSPPAKKPGEEEKKDDKTPRRPIVMPKKSP